MIRKIILNGQEVEVPESANVKLIAVEGDDAELSIDGRTVIVPFLRRGDEIQFVWRGETYTAEVSARPRARKRGDDHSMSAPMPGTVLKIFVEPGDVVAKGDPLLILEAMKMEHQIAAPYPGTIEAIHCSAGEMVQPGVELISIQRAEGE